MKKLAWCDIELELREKGIDPEKLTDIDGLKKNSKESRKSITKDWKNYFERRTYNAYTK